LNHIKAKVKAFNIVISLSNSKEVSSMKAYMLMSNKTIEPFGDHPRDCLIINRKLSELQECALRSLDCVLESVSDVSEIKDPDEHIIFFDSLYFTEKLLAEFINRSRELKKYTLCAISPGVTVLRTISNTQDVQTFDDRIEYGLYYKPAESQNEVPVPVIIDLDQFFEAFLMPEHMFGEKDYPVPVSDWLIAQIDHWTNLWIMSIATVLSEGAKLRRTSKLKLLGLALKARSFNQWKVISKLNHIGNNCDIHHTAYIEGSTIGNNVRIGAGSVIRESVIGDDSYIGNNVTVDLSVLGAECNIRNGAVIQYAVLYPGTLTMNRLISLSICGRNTFVGDGVVLSDFRLDSKPVTVLKDGKQTDTANVFVGSCLGHDVYLGAGCIVAPGRTIPNRTRITPDESRIIRKCHAEQEIHGHRLVEVLT
jgi:acetyltransferase-like isoleucine patch superfamily enzyme